MFLNLAQGSIIYGVETKNEMKVFTAPVVSVSLPRQKYINNNFGQLSDTVVDIVATVNGERKEYKQIPANSSIADFGEGNFILSDSKDAINAYISSLLQNSRNVIASVDKHQYLVEQYEKVLAELNPVYNSKGESKEVKELKEDVNSLKVQLAEAIALLKKERKLE